MTPPPSDPAPPSRTALAPRRRPGKERVAALLAAGGAVIAERGYAGATMAEIAARAGAPIGSLYRFFPSKEALADALVQRYLDLVHTAYEAIAETARTVPLETLADRLLDAFAALRDAKAPLMELIDVRPDGSEMRTRLKRQYLEHVTRILITRDPALDPAAAEAIGSVLLLNMKAMGALDEAADAAGIAEMRTMTRLYLASKLRG